MYCHLQSFEWTDQKQSTLERFAQIVTEHQRCQSTANHNIFMLKISEGVYQLINLKAPTVRYPQAFTTTVRRSSLTFFSKAK